jgi:hypothetical protein
MQQLVPPSSMSPLRVAMPVMNMGMMGGRQVRLSSTLQAASQMRVNQAASYGN